MLIVSLLMLARLELSDVQAVASGPVRDAGRVTVAVTVPGASSGEVGCSLFAGAEGFPLDPSRATVVWQAAAPALTCRFDSLPPGEYAVAISHDLNGNRKTDRNFVGIPQEAWGVSNNVRPRLRAPRFDEARLTLTAEQELAIAIEVRK